MLITFKKVGNHWYPDINHDRLEEIQMDRKFERLFNIMDKFDDKIIEVNLIRQDLIIISEGLIEFKESDITRYVSTKDYFIMDVYINNHKFQISTDLFTALERNYNFNFPSEIYRVSFYEI